MKANEEKRVARDLEIPAATNTAVLEGSEIGEVKIHENVIFSLVLRATREVEGVSRLAGNSLVDNIAEIVGSRRMQARAINVIMAGDNRVQIEVKLNIKFGFRVPDVAEKVQKAVVSMVENTTAMSVTRVDVLVQEIEEEVQVAEPEEEADTMTMVSNLPIN